MDTKYVAFAVVAVIVIVGGLFLWLSPGAVQPEDVAVLDTAAGGQPQAVPETTTGQSAGASTAQYVPSASGQSAAVSANSEAAKAATVTYPSGLIAQDLVIGTGATAETGRKVVVNYIGWLADGTKFDASSDHGGTFSFNLGAGQVIKGWDQGVVGMKEGGKRKLVIPADLAYGPRGTGPIPPNATLTFEVQLVKVQ